MDCQVHCGDGELDVDEVCDDARAPEQFCTDFSGFDMGSLGCSSCDRVFDDCVQFDWSPMSSGTTASLNGVWGSGPDDVFAVGDGGVIVHYDGDHWSDMVSNTGSNLNAIWGSGPDNVIAVGNQGVIVQWDGSVWSPMQLAPSADFVDISGSHPSNVFAVRDDGILHRYNGVSWQPFVHPGEWVNRVWVRALDDVYAVGGGAIFHYDEEGWHREFHDGLAWFEAVWGSDAGDVFAVGAGGLVMRRNVSSEMWSTMSPNTEAYLLGVWGRGSDDVFAVGYSGAIMHWNGVLWSEMHVGTSPVPTLLDVWGIGVGDVFAVGDPGTIVHHGAVSWYPIASAANLPISPLAMWVHEDDVYVVGDSISRLDGGSLHDFPDLPDAGVTLRAIWGSESTGEAVAVGTGSGTKIYHFDGDDWAAADDVPKEIDSLHLNAVWGSGPADVFAVAGNGTIVHYNGSIWSTMARPTSSSLLGIWGSGPADVFAVGFGGIILHYDGVAWSTMEMITGHGPYWALRGLWGSAPDDVFAVGDDVLALPDPDHAELFISEDGRGRWFVETSAGDCRPIADQEVIVWGERSWRIALPLVREKTLRRPTGPIALADVGLVFRVSRNEEHVEITVLSGDTSITLPPRSHGYVLLTLARIRLEDRARAQLPESEHGWVYIPQLVEMLDVNPNQLNLAIHRARVQFRQANVLGAVDLFERRPGSRQIRLGVVRVEICE